MGNHETQEKNGERQLTLPSEFWEDIPDSELPDNPEIVQSAIIPSVGTRGWEVVPIQVQVAISASTRDSMWIGGLANGAPQEAKRTVEKALKANGFFMPAGKIDAKLSPSSFRKTGSYYELPIAIALLEATGQIEDGLHTTLVVGELSLEGRVNPVDPVTDIAPMVFMAKRLGYPRIIVPYDNWEAAYHARALVDPDEQLEIVPVESLSDVVKYTQGELNQPEPVLRGEINLPEKKDFADVKGHEQAKWALEVAAAGGHHVLMVGPPGSGKTMLSERLPSILPPLTTRELIDVLMVQAMNGEFSEETMYERLRPFRRVDSVSLAGMVGSSDGPGEFSLSHRGVLFIDEIVHTNKDVIEALRTVLTHGKMMLVRKGKYIEFPARFLLIGAMNPCPCGYHGEPGGRCGCAPKEVSKYRKQLSKSGPIASRFDIKLKISPVPFDVLEGEELGEPSADIRKRVLRARQKQQERFAGFKHVTCNAEMDVAEINQFCHLDEEAKVVLQAVVKKLMLDNRGIHKIKKIARTIADLKDHDAILPEDIFAAAKWQESW